MTTNEAAIPGGPLRTGTLKIRGATLHFETCGSGPVLLLIPGGPADARTFSALRSALADRYSVATYDPRGLSRSAFDGTPQDTTIETFADDAHQLLAMLGGEPAYVLGHSGGALVGLELATQHPEQVRALVAHEPPLSRLLDDSDEQRRFAQDVYDTYRSQGVGPAMGKFMASAGLGQEPAEPAPDTDEAMARMQANLEFFLGHMWLPLADYQPDLVSLRSRPITVAVGEASHGQLAHRAGLALAGHLGRQAAVFPGGHAGPSSHPEAFARCLHEAFGRP
ncbi:MAG TPA: alpha/beta hydrolase [Trueperaceae bacterium]